MPLTVPTTEALQAAGCALTAGEVTELLHSKIAGSAIMDLPVDAAFHSRGMPRQAWFPWGKPRQDWSAKQWAQAVEQMQIVKSLYEMAHGGSSECSRDMTRPDHVASNLQFCKASYVKHLDTGTKYIVFGRRDQLTELWKTHLDDANVLSLERFGPDSEEPLDKAQQILLRGAVDFGMEGNVTVCCPGGTNRSAFLCGLLRIRREMAGSDPMPVTRLYHDILDAYRTGSTLEASLQLQPERKKRKRHNYPYTGE